MFCGWSVNSTIPSSFFDRLIWVVFPHECFAPRPNKFFPSRFLWISIPVEGWYNHHPYIHDACIISHISNCYYFQDVFTLQWRNDVFSVLSSVLQGLKLFFWKWTMPLPYFWADFAIVNFPYLKHLLGIATDSPRPEWGPVGRGVFRAISPAILPHNRSKKTPLKRWNHIIGAPAPILSAFPRSFPAYFWNFEFECVSGPLKSRYI